MKLKVKNITAFAPASIANLNCGFDALGMALSGIGDRITLQVATQNYISDIINGPDISSSFQDNCAGVVINSMQDHIGQKAPKTNVIIDKGFTSGSGWGSSSASCVAAAVAYNGLIGGHFSKTELLEFAALGEKVSSGVPHFDNVAASLFGGLVMVTNTPERKVIELPFSSEIHVLSVLPQMSLNTKMARSIIPDEVQLEAAVKQSVSLATFVAGCYLKDSKIWSAGMKDDLIEFHRKKHIPEFDILKMKAVEEGALTFGIAGSGPSVFALFETKESAKTTAQNWKNCLKIKGIDSKCYLGKIGHHGAHLCTSYHQKHNSEGTSLRN